MRRALVTISAIGAAAVGGGLVLVHNTGTAPPAKPPAKLCAILGPLPPPDRAALAHGAQPAEATPPPPIIKTIPCKTPPPPPPWAVTTHLP